MGTGKVKTCPFCGYEPHIVGYTDGTWRVECMYAYCTMNPKTRARADKRKAIEQWNRRVEG